ncbi:phosphotransferase family protein [Oceanobacillus salinisoli]|uniref:phosphotransferase family protein n=1 Tax=Oceanobacillus salinisoli TaxID=2678611 RepID=UPI0012E19709|nr:phosphotransferase family protein [Oceanobacillus salinisoli]
MKIENEQDMKSVLANYINEQIIKADHIEVVQFFKASGGWSDDVFILKVRWGENDSKKEQNYVVRKKKDGPMIEEKDFLRQFNILDILSKDTNLPVPEVYCYEKDKSIIGNEFIVMEKIEGKSYVPWSIEGRQFFKKASKGNIRKEFVSYLAALHSLDYHSLLLDHHLSVMDSKIYLDRKIEELEGLYQQHKFIEDPLITDAFEWLKKNKPEPIPLAVIHNDYRTGNLLYEDDIVTGILDWESIEIGDPRLDIGYVCSKSNRMDSPLMCYLISREEFYSLYKQDVNFDFDEKDIYYFEVYHQLRFYMISLLAGDIFVRKGSTDLRMVRQGFRSGLMKHMLAELLGY